MSMFNFGYNRRPTGLFSQLDDPANIAAIAQRRVPMAMPQDDDEEERRQRRGLFGGARRDTFLGNIMQFMNAEQGGASNWDRLAHAAAMMRDDPSFALASQRRLDGLRADYDERQARAAQQLQGFAAQKQAGHAERERLNALADSLGLQGQQRALFLMSPEDARNEFIGSRMNPEPMGAPTTRTVNRGGEIVTEQWNPQTQQFEEIGRAPRWNADAAAEGGQQGDRREREDQLRGEYSGIAEDYQELLRQYDVAETAYAQNNAVGDLQLIVAVTKALDPGSVAREGEVALTRSAQSVLEQYRTQGARMFEGNTRLGPNVRDELISSLRDLEQRDREAFTRQRGFYESMVEREELDPRNVFNWEPRERRDPEGGGGQPREGATRDNPVAMPAQIGPEFNRAYARLQPGQFYRHPDGTIRRKR